MKVNKSMLTCLAKIARGEVYKHNGYHPKRGGYETAYGGAVMAKKAVAAGLANAPLWDGLRSRAYWTLTDAGREALRQAGMLEDHKERI